MISVIAIDPGKDTGWAFFKRGILTTAGLIVEKEFGKYYDDLREIFETHWDVDLHVVIERPQVYPQRKWRGDPNDLIDVAIKAGAAALALDYSTEVEFVMPREWKGQQPKKINHAQTLARLSDEERKVIDELKIPASKRHNTLDAAGIGIWKLGRK